ncbi:MAG: hypothetical protein ACLQAN_04990 [Acidimicrobiales bacterium]
MKFRHMAPVVAGAAMMVVASLGVVSTASADTTTTTTPASLSQMQAKLEAELAARQTQLSTLTTDVSSSKTLTASDAAALSSSLSTETSNIGALVTKVPTDTTVAELRVDAQAMFRDNRVFDVMTPQVHLTIAADSVNANAGTILADGLTITAALAARTSDKGYARVEALFTSLTAKATDAQSALTSVSSDVLAQTPAGWPGNAHVFVQAKVEILRARIDLAYARAELRLVERWISRYPVPAGATGTSTTTTTTANG